MAYAHAERNLALLRQIEAETRQLLESLDQPDPGQSAWLQEVTAAGHRGGRNHRGGIQSRRKAPSHRRQHQPAEAYPPLRCRHLALQPDGIPAL
jgi:hypothetical protein